MPRHLGAPSGPVLVGTVAATLALIGTALPARTGTPSPPLMAAVLGSAGCVVVFLLAHRSPCDRRILAAIGSVFGLLTVIAGTVALNTGVVGDVPIVGSTGALVGAIGAGGVVIAAACSLYGGLDGPSMVDRALLLGSMAAIGALGLVAIYLSAVVLVTLVVMLPGGPNSATALSRPAGVALTQAATVLGIGSVAIGYLFATDRSWAFIDLAVPNRWDLAYIIGGILAVLGAAIALSRLLELTGTETATHSSIQQAMESPEILLVLIPASVLVIGPFEELLYRNVVQKTLYETFSRPGAVVGASVPFAIVHITAFTGSPAGQALVSLGFILALSLLIGAVYERTHNLVVPALVHGGYNAAVFLQIYFSQAG